MYHLQLWGDKKQVLLAVAIEISSEGRAEDLCITPGTNELQREWPQSTKG
jgi:hypothetical protein